MKRWLVLLFALVHGACENSEPATGSDPRVTTAVSGASVPPESAAIEQERREIRDRR